MTEHLSSESTESSSSRFVQIDSALLNQLLDAKLSATEWSLYMYLIDLDPFGDRQRDLPKPTDIMMRLGIKKTAFYTAMARLRELNLYEIDATTVRGRNPNGTKAGNFNSSPSENSPLKRKTFRDDGKCSAKTNSDSGKTEPQFGKTELDSAKTEKRSLKVLPGGNPGSPHNTHTSNTLNKRHTLSYPPRLGSMEEPATAEEQKAIAEWVRGEFKEWLDLAISFQLITPKGICFSNINRKPAIKTPDGRGVLLLEEWLEKYPLETLKSWLEEIESGMHAGK